MLRWPRVQPLPYTPEGHLCTLKKTQIHKNQKSKKWKRTPDAPHKGARDASGAEGVKQTFFWKIKNLYYKFEL